MTNIDLKAWAESPKLRRCSLQARCVWLLLALHGRAIAQSDFHAVANVEPAVSAAVLAELMTADLVEMDGLPMFNPTFRALPPEGECMTPQSLPLPDLSSNLIH